MFGISVKMTARVRGIVGSNPVTPDAFISSKFKYKYKLKRKSKYKYKFEVKVKTLCSKYYKVLGGKSILANKFQSNASIAMRRPLRVAPAHPRPSN